MEISFRRSPSTPPTSSITRLIFRTSSSDRSFTRMSALTPADDRMPASRVPAARAGGLSRRGRRLDESRRVEWSPARLLRAPGAKRRADHRPGDRIRDRADTRGLGARDLRQPVFRRHIRDLCLVRRPRPADQACSDPPRPLDPRELPRGIPQHPRDVLSMARRRRLAGAGVRRADGRGARSVGGGRALHDDPAVLRGRPPATGQRSHSRARRGRFTGRGHPSSRSSTPHGPAGRGRSRPTAARRSAAAGIPSPG